MVKSLDLFTQCHLHRASCVQGRVLCAPQTPAHSIRIPSSMRRVPLHPHLPEGRTEAQRSDVTSQRHTVTTETRSEPTSPGSSVHSLNLCPELQDSSGSGGYEERRKGKHLSLAGCSLPSTVPGPSTHTSFHPPSKILPARRQTQKDQAYPASCWKPRLREAKTRGRK